MVGFPAATALTQAPPSLLLALAVLTACVAGLLLRFATNPLLRLNRAWWWVFKRNNKAVFAPLEAGPRARGSPDTKEYRTALARTRQAVSVNRAIVYKNAGNPARALVELRRSLQENAIAREPLLSARMEKQDLLDLYRLHLLNSEVPPDFPTLLQLREMCEISNDEAEALEAEVMESGTLFSI